MRIIISNKIRCKRCGDVIESKSHYDLEKCSCGLCCVDGGKDYVRRVIRTTEGGKYADYCEASRAMPHGCRVPLSGIRGRRLRVPRRAFSP